MSLLDANHAGRTDAEYYDKNNIHNDLLLKEKQSISIGSFCYTTDGEHGTPDWDLNSNIKYITAENIKDCFIQETGFNFISKKQDTKNTRSHLKEGDILYYSVGAYCGYSALAEKHLFPANIPRSVAIIRSKSLLFLSEYIAIFLNSKFGMYQSHRLRSGNAQPMIAIEKMKQINIPPIDIKLQNILKLLYQTAYECRLESKKYFSQAQNLLLSELDLVDYKPKHQTVYTKTLSEVFESKRMDAEYFQPKYENIENRIKGYKGGYSRVFEKFTHNKQMFKNPQNDTEYLYTEISDVNVSTGEVDSNLIPAKELPDNAKRILQKGDLIISKVRTYRGGIGIVSQDNVIGSGAFTVLQENKNSDYNIETLFAFLRLKPILEWTLKPNTGTSYPVIVDDDILNMLIPNIPPSLQNEIAKHIQTSNFARKQSRKLLEIAKQAVELAIEQNEAVATEFIKGECEKIGVVIE